MLVFASPTRWARSLLLLVLIPFLASCGGGGSPDNGGGTPPPTKIVSEPEIIVEPRKPNIVFIMLDDVGYGDFGSYGGTYIRTPHIDALAEEGTLFSQFYAPAPVCSPTRTSLLTGEYAAEFGVRRALHYTTSRGIPKDVTTIADRLKSEGYATAHFGKWHVGGIKPEFLPDQKGFDQSAILGKDSDLASQADRDVWYQDHTFLENGVSWVQSSGYLTQATTDYAIDFIEQHDDEPFFVNLWHFAGHRPYTPPPVGWESVYDYDTEAGRYGAIISDVDAQIGRVVQTLDRLGLSENTLIVVTSDNGGRVRTINTNGVLRGYKGHMFEGGIRVPMIARWPGTIPADTINDSLVMGFDFFPTLIDIAGGEIASLNLPGKSFKSALTSNTTQSRSDPLIWQNKFIRPWEQIPQSGISNSFAVRKDYSDGRQWKIVFENDITYLFDLASDIKEENNLASINPEVVSDLLQDHATWREIVGRVYPRIEKTEGAVIINGEDMQFTGPGRVTLEPDTRYDFNNADFTFGTWIKLSPESFEDNVSVIAKRLDSWSLEVSSNDNLVQLTLWDDATKERSGYVGATVIEPNKWYHIAFTVYGWRDFDSRATLYINGLEELTTTSVSDIGRSDEQVVFGNNKFFGVSDNTGSLIGTMHGYRFYLSSFTKDEIVKLMNQTNPK